MSLCLGLGLAIGSVNALAQEQEQANEQNSSNADVPASQRDDVEQIEVQGRAGDAALQAFQMGNFELAEIQFNKNAECALRAERNLRAFTDDARNAQLNQSLANGFSSSGPTTDAIGSSSMNSGSNLQTKAPLRELTCTDRGYQIYMVGMSQLQMGRAEEAEESFERAIRLNKHLHDAMYRLALMKLLREDTEGATEHYEDMQALLKRCNNICDAQANIQAGLDFLEKALAGKVRK
ncbi:hypothetical protein [Glaciecola siphonariae]